MREELRISLGGVGKAENHGARGSEDSPYFFGN